MKKVFIFLILFTGLFLFIKDLEATEIGVFRGAKFYLDSNGNLLWDKETDSAVRFGLNGDIPVTGDWDGDGVTEIGVVRDGMWYLDSNGSNSWDEGLDSVINFGFNGDIPVTGDWNGDGVTDIGVFRDGAWYLDLNGNLSWDKNTDSAVWFGLNGDIPVTGDWDGDGVTDIGVFRDGMWYLDSNGSNSWDEGLDSVINFGLSGDIPVTGDWDEDGVTDIGVLRGDVWFLDSNGNDSWDGGVDSVVKFGLKNDIPVTGHFGGNLLPPPPSSSDGLSDDFEDGVMGPQWSHAKLGSSVTEANGILQVTFDNASASAISDGYVSVSSEAGDFDVQVDFSNFSAANAYAQVRLMFMVDGSNFFQAYRQGVSATDNRIAGYANIGGVTSYAWDASGAASGKLRIVRSGTNIEMYYNIGAGWVLVHSATGFSTASGTFNIWGDVASGAALSCDFDNFTDNLYSGSPAPPPPPLQIGPAYYVDFNNGNDFNDGTTSNTPFKHAPGDDNAVGAAASVGLQPGDTVIFKGGVVYYGRVDADWNGSPGNYITYKSGHLVSWGTGRAILDGTSMTYDFYHTGVLSLKGNRYLKAEGLHVRNVPYGNGYLGGIGWKGRTNGEVDIVIDNVEATNNCNGIMIQGLWVEDTNPPTGFVIRNSVLHDNLEHGILLRSHLEDIIVANNQIYNNGWQGGPYVGDGLFTADGDTGRPMNILIQNNEFYDGKLKGHIVFQGANNVILENNKFYEKNNWVRFGVAISKGDGFLIRNNLFLDTNDTAELEGLIRIHTDNTLPSPADITNVEIYNNTFVGATFSAIFISWGNGHVIDNVKVKNNIFKNGGKDYYIYSKNGTIKNFQSDNNIYFGGISSPFYWNYSSVPFSTWKTITGQDYASSEVNPSLDSNYRPDSPSDPPVNAGVDLSATGFSGDKNGTRRPQGYSWDIGCYELVY